MSEPKGAPSLVPLSEYGLELIESAAKRKNCAPTTVRRWVQLGYLRAVRVGEGRSAKYLVPIKEVDAYQPNPAGAPEGNTNAAKKKPRGRKKGKPR